MVMKKEWFSLLVCLHCGVSVITLVSVTAATASWGLSALFRRVGGLSLWRNDI